MKKLIGIVILSVAVVFPLAAGGSSDKTGKDNESFEGMTELKIGSIINGNLEPGDEIWYLVRTRDAGILIVETTGNTDTYLEAYDTRRNLLAENDDSGSNNNARVEVIAAARASYLFKLTGYDEYDSGAYRIMAAYDPMPPMTELRPGSFLNGKLASGEEQWYTVRADRNGLLVVETTGDTDTLLEVRDENFNYITYDDDGGEDLNAKIEIGVVQGKVYYFKLWAYDDEDSGSFRIMAEITDYPVPVQLAPGASISGNITRGASFWYSVKTQSRGILVVETTGDVDTYLYAYSDSYELLATDDDGGEDYNARIELSAEANRTYIFKLRGLSYEDTGPFRIFASVE